MSDTIDLILEKDVWIAIATNPLGLYIKSNDTGRWRLAAMTGEDPPDDELDGEIYEGQSHRYLESFDGTIYLRVDTDDHPFSITDGIGSTYSRTTDGFGNPISSFKGALSVYDSDVNAIMVNEHLRQDEGTTDTLAAAASIGDRDITVTDGTQFTVDDRIVMYEGELRESSTIKITGIAGDVLSMDKPLEHDYTTAAVVDKIIKSLNVDGSVTPQVFEIAPPPNEIWHIYRMTIAMVHTTVSSDDRFGNLNKLENGLVLRQTNGFKHNLSVWRDNSDIIEDTGVDLRYSAKSGGGLFGTAARWTFKRAGTVLTLDGSKGDTYQAIVQDDLSGATMVDIEIKIQGHVEGA